MIPPAKVFHNESRTDGGERDHARRTDEGACLIRDGSRPSSPRCSTAARRYFPQVVAYAARWHRAKMLRVWNNECCSGFGAMSRGGLLLALT